MDKSGYIYLSGNRDKIGTSLSILKQISHEGRTDGRLSSTELDSIMRMKIKYLVNDRSTSDVKGFIQLISVDLVVLFLCTEGGICIFQDICKMDAVTWDTTSKIVKTRLTDKPLYYYELMIRNPTTGQISLPVAIMISSDQTSLPCSIGCPVLEMMRKEYTEQVIFRSQFKLIVIALWCLS